MGLESGTYISDLNVAYPDGADPKSEGDNHLRLIKTLLKATFPGMAGAAWRVQAKSAGYTVVANDNMSIFNCTSALTLSGTAAATLGNQHMVLVMANGGDVVFDPSGVETVNGAATLTIPNGSSAFIACNAGAFLAFPLVGLAAANIWTALQTIRVAGGLRVEQAATQDAVVLAGRAGGTSSYEVTVSPAALTADRTAALPDQSGTVALLENVQAQTGVAYTTGGSSTAFTLTPTPALAALVENQEFDVEFHTAAGATPTLTISGLTAKNLKYRDSTGTLTAVTSTQVPSGWRSKVTYDGTDYIVREVPASSGGLTLGTMQTWSSGVSQDFTGIPAGVKQITVNLSDISMAGSSNIIIQIGDSGGVETSGYVGISQGSSTLQAWSSGICVERGSSSAVYQQSGSITLTLMDAATNKWAVSGSTATKTNGGTDYTNDIAGYKALSATLDRVRITTIAGTDTGDGGTWNIAYQ